jgi:hypothetical protein
MKYSGITFLKASSISQTASRIIPAKATLRITAITVRLFSLFNLSSLKNHLIIYTIRVGEFCKTIIALLIRFINILFFAVNLSDFASLIQWISKNLRSVIKRPKVTLSTRN